MVRLRKLMEAVAAVVRACAHALVAVAISLIGVAERIEKRSASK